ncbi:hypothetical protein D805_0358 [Bifidobacterium thermophilum RBL67]|uniref:Uncharacterized protein n=1 Tax=Bifidobacterium thermophilum RBL67 TaxID=1254439 RepID=M4RB14_9BIFI|nr:hypothetical protein D805_0358 [Bifidobacterium thermophilum RBL67]
MFPPVGGYRGLDPPAPRDPFAKCARVASGFRRPLGRRPQQPGKEFLLYFVKLICTVSSFFLDSFVVHSGRFGLSGFLLVLFGYFISEWVFL